MNIIKENMSEMDRSTELRFNLKNYVLNINFLKLNGEGRKMRCTLIPDYLPKVDKEPKITKPLPEDVIRVWDMDKKAWRSFIVGNVTSANIVY